MPDLGTPRRVLLAAATAALLFSFAPPAEANNVGCCLARRIGCATTTKSMCRRYAGRGAGFFFNLNMHCTAANTCAANGPGVTACVTCQRAGTRIGLACESSADCDGGVCLETHVCKDGKCPFPVLDGSSDLDSDGDGIIDFEDNCPWEANPEQADEDGDGIGDLCPADTDGTLIWLPNPSDQLSPAIKRERN